MPRLPLKLAGGIGDCLLDISRVPISAMGAVGVGVEFYYTQPDHPASQIVKDFLPFIRRGRVSSDPLPKNLNWHRLANYLGRIFHKSPLFFAPPIIGIESKKSLHTSIRILIQTHMDGHHNLKCFSAKVWAIKNWIEYIRLISKIPNVEVRILEWDPEAVTEFVRALPNTPIIGPKKLRESIQEVAHSDILVSIDSWTKYVARWFNKKQIIVLPDLRNNYTPHFSNITADEVIHRWFFGISGRKNIKIIGVEKKGGVFQYTLDKLSNLQPNYLYEETRVLASN
jgi:hypothetical protein